VSYNTGMEELKFTPLNDHLNRNTEYTVFASYSVRAHYGDPAAEHTALTRNAALVDRSYKPVLRLSGRDPLGMLNAILTNEVSKTATAGVYAALLNPKGRIQTDLRVLKSNKDVLIDIEPEGAVPAREILGRYAPFSRVEVEDLSEGDVPWGILGIYGPHAEELLGGPRLAEHESTEIRVGDTPLLAAGVAVPVPGFDLLGPAEDLRVAREHLVQAGAKPAGHDAYETARVAAGIPRFGADINPENFPAEAGILERAVSFTKGCYPGQETVARMHYRGHPNKTLRRLVIQGPSPEPGQKILQGKNKLAGPASTGIPVGWITSVAPLPVNGKILALGYLSRKAEQDAPLFTKEADILLAS
jgi:folate-binding protein YgfZ